VLNPLAWYERHLMTLLERAENYLGGLQLARAQMPDVYDADIRAQEMRTQTLERRLASVRRLRGRHFSERLSPPLATEL
jgi:hypothetical protein